MSNFFLQKNFAKPGEVVSIKGECVFSGSLFDSSDRNIAIVTNQDVNVVGIGETTIFETGSTNCENTNGIVFTSTEDGKPFFMTKEQYNDYNNYEMIFIVAFLFITFLIRLGRQ